MLWDTEPEKFSCALCHSQLIPIGSSILNTAPSWFVVGRLGSATSPRVLLGQPLDGLLHALIGEQRFDRIVLLFQLLVAEKCMDGTVTITADGQLFLAATTLGDQMMITDVKHLTVA